MTTARPILRSYLDGLIDFDSLVDQLASFEWRKPAPSGDPWGVNSDPEPLGAEGTFEEVDAAADAGWITKDEHDRIHAAVYARAHT